jgi:hypothetical protein
VATGRLLHAVGDGGTAYDFAAVQIVGPRMAYADNALEFFPQFLLPPLLACGDVVSWSKFLPPCLADAGRITSFRTQHPDHLASRTKWYCKWGLRLSKLRESLSTWYVCSLDVAGAFG